jgi:hypothetical protein
MIEWENEDKDAHQSSTSEIEILIFSAFAHLTLVFPSASIQQGTKLSTSIGKIGHKTG